MMTYEDFRTQIEQTLRAAGDLTWTELRTAAKLPQAFPNNQWVHRLEKDIGLERKRDAHGIIHWRLTGGAEVDYRHAAIKPTKPAKRASEAISRKQDSVE